MSLSVIYCIENIINGHVYIGSAVDYKDRKRLHIQHLNKNKFFACNSQV
jgi:predicted GIY-YIG superfamily endonuclease